LINLRHITKFLYPVEILLNIFIICWHFRQIKRNTSLVFDVHGALNLAPIVAARISSIAVVWHIHETINGAQLLVKVGKAVLAGFKHQKVVVASSAERIFGLPDSLHIPGSVDSAFWRLKTSREQEEDKVTLLAIGNLNPLKGHDVLIEALRELDLAVELSIVGAKLDTYSSYSKKLESNIAEINALGLHKVRLLGWRSEVEIRDLLSNSDIFVLPSRSEACPLALLEAMSTGCACIASNVGDVAKIIGSTKGALLVRGGNPGDLRRAIKELAVGGRERRTAMGLLARDRVLDDYSCFKIASSHLKVYRKFF